MKMKYRLRIPRTEQNELERVPMDVALQLERHLERIAELASQTPAGDPIWTQCRDPQSGLLKCEWKGFCLLYEVDRDSESVVVSSVKKIHPPAIRLAKSNV